MEFFLKTGIILTLFYPTVGLRCLISLRGFFYANQRINWATWVLTSVTDSCSTQYSWAQTNVATVAKPLWKFCLSQFCELAQSYSIWILVHIVVGCQTYATVLHPVWMSTRSEVGACVARLFSTRTGAPVENVFCSRPLLFYCCHKVALASTITLTPLWCHSCRLQHL